MENEELADVGGKAFNGDPLPKRKQSDAWMVVARTAKIFISKGQ